MVTYPLSEQHGLKARERMYTAHVGGLGATGPEAIQELLEEEVTEFRRALRSDSDSDTGYRNGEHTIPIVICSQ